MNDYKYQGVNQSCELVLTAVVILFWAFCNVDFYIYFFSLCIYFIFYIMQCININIRDSEQLHNDVCYSLRSKCSH